MSSLHEPLLISFVPLRQDHFSLLHQWLNSPHLQSTWGENKRWSLSDVEEKYLSYTQGFTMDHGSKRAIHAFIIEADEVPLGFIQYYSAFDFEREDFAIAEVWPYSDRTLAALDVYIGDPAFLSRGLGSKALRQFLEEIVYDEYHACLVDPSIDNERAMAAYLKAGFVRKEQKGDCLIMIAEKVYLAPYSEEWPKEFEREKKKLLPLLASDVEIEHIGSTSIPPLSVKPVIDIMIGVSSLKKADEEYVEAMISLGYVYYPQYEAYIPERRFFIKTSPSGQRTHQIHLVEMGSNWWKRHLLFRDYLRSHADTRNEYEKLKQTLAKQHTDIHQYSMAKDTFCRAIEKKAFKELS